MTWLVLFILSIRYFRFRQLSAQALPLLTANELAEMRRSSLLALVAWLTTMVLTTVMLNVLAGVETARGVAAAATTPISTAMSVTYGLGLTVAAVCDLRAERLKRRGVQPTSGPLQGLGLSRRRLVLYGVLLILGLAYAAFALFAGRSR
jgi:hypothetical protein